MSKDDCMDDACLFPGGSFQDMTRVCNDGEKNVGILVYG